MNNFMGLLSIMRVDRMQNARVTELRGVTKRVDERIDESGKLKEYRTMGFLKKNVLVLVKKGYGCWVNKWNGEW